MHLQLLWYSLIRKSPHKRELLTYEEEKRSWVYIGRNSCRGLVGKWFLYGKCGMMIGANAVAAANFLQFIICVVACLNTSPTHKKYRAGREEDYSIGMHLLMMDTRMARIPIVPSWSSRKYSIDCVRFGRPLCMISKPHIFARKYQILIEFDGPRALNRL